MFHFLKLNLASCIIYLFLATWSPDVLGVSFMHESKAEFLFLLIQIVQQKQSILSELP